MALQIGGDINVQASQTKLNEYLASRSYIEGYVLCIGFTLIQINLDHSLSRYTASQSDVVLFGALKAAPAASLAHALRWYNHIKSIGDAKAKLPGVKKSLADFGVTGGAATPGKAAAKPAADDDDDVDLFGSDDDEVDEEAERIKQERLAAYAAKKSKSMYLHFVI